MKHKTLYILLVEKKPILRKRFFERLKNNDEARFRLWQWVTQNHKRQRHFECFINTERKHHVAHVKRYASHYFMEFTVSPTPELAPLISIIFDTHKMVEYYQIEPVFYAWLSDTIHKMISEQCSNKCTYQIEHPVEYLSESFRNYPMLSESLFRTKGVENLVYGYAQTIKKIARSLFYLIGNVLGYHIRYPQSLLLPNYSN